VFTPTFLTSAASPRQFPADRGSEVAFVGRSNSGKSSAINAILGVRSLARVSKTPGRTQLVNFFAVGDDKRVVDLPGYGYAKVEEAVRERWRRLVSAYLEGRRSLRGLVVTLDIRRGVTEGDELMLEWARRLELPVLALLTKADKLSRGAALAAERAAAARLGEAGAAVLFSAPKGTGVQEARARLGAWLGLPPPTAPGGSGHAAGARSAGGEKKKAPGAGFRGHTRGTSPGGVTGKEPAQGG